MNRQGLKNSSEPLTVLDIRGLFSFRALGDFEGYFLTFFKGFEPIHLNGGKMCEQIFAAIIGCNETITFCIVEPLNSTCCHVLVNPIFDTGWSPGNRLGIKTRNRAKQTSQANAQT
jgi:hypothetical protein